MSDPQKNPYIAADRLRAELSQMEDPDDRAMGAMLLMGLDYITYVSEHDPALHARALAWATEAHGVDGISWHRLEANEEMPTNDKEDSDED